LAECIQISLAAARVNAKMTQEEVANRMKVGKKTIINWEKGVSIPSFADMNMLSDIYRIPVDNIFLPRKST
jgi:transcriptional regulator with XRE-family HTH domain